MGVRRHAFFEYPFHGGLQQVIPVGGITGQGYAEPAQTTQLREQCLAL